MPRERSGVPRCSRGRIASPAPKLRKFCFVCCIHVVQTNIIPPLQSVADRRTHAQKTAPKLKNKQYYLASHNAYVSIFTWKENVGLDQLLELEITPATNKRTYLHLHHHTKMLDTPTPSPPTKQWRQEFDNQHPAHEQTPRQKTAGDVINSTATRL